MLTVIDSHATEDHLNNNDDDIVPLEAVVTKPNSPSLIAGLIPPKKEVSSFEENGKGTHAVALYHKLIDE